MTVTAQLLARQRKDGEPIRVRARRTSTETTGSPSWTWFGIGVTLAATPPATFAGFAHYEGGSGIDGIWRGLDNYSFTYGDEAQTRAGCRLDLTRVEPLDLDADYAAGRYLWFVCSPVDPPISSTVPEALGGPYLIH